LIMSPLWQFGDVSGSKVNRRLSEGSTPFAATVLHSGALNGRFRTHVRPVRAETTRGANLQIPEAWSEFSSVWALGAVIKKQMLFARVATCAWAGLSRLYRGGLLPKTALYRGWGPREREVRVIVIERLGGTRPSSLSTLVSKSCSLPSLDSGISGEHLLSGHVFRGRRDPTEAGDRCVRSAPLNPQNWPEITFSEFRGADE
jgi:hypothetical protein